MDKMKKLNPQILGLNDDEIEKMLFMYIPLDFVNNNPDIIKNQLQ